MRQHSYGLLVVSLFCSLLLLSGCGGSAGNVAPSARLLALSITPASSNLHIGDASSVSVSGIYSDGSNASLDNSAEWSVTPAIASIETDGLLRCSGNGAATISATIDNLTATAAVNCSVPNTQATTSSSDLLSQNPVSINIVTRGSTVPVGYSIRASATVTSDAGTSDITQSAQWSVSPSRYASVNAGKITCLQAGVVTVAASASAASGTANVTCAPSTFNSPTVFIEQSAEFTGPFSSWTDLKGSYAAKGDGLADDTQAIQSALNDLSSTHVLYIPAGTYRITETLNIAQKEFFAIIGSDPRTTRIIWDGPNGQTMLNIDGSSTFRVSRLTFDGSRKASAAEVIGNVTNGLYTTKVELSDQHLLNLEHGIYLNNSAETEITRVFFDHLTTDGVLLTNFNNINVFVTDSLFSYCGTGVSNDPGAGSFNVSNSFFDHSVSADMRIGNTGNFAARHNTSLDSGGSFFLAGVIGANNAEIIIQGNTVIDPAGTAVSIGDTGPLMLIDNVFRTQDIDSPVVTGWDNSTTPPTAFSFGNIYTASQPLAQFWGPVTSYDDSTVDASSIPTPSVPANVFVPVDPGRRRFEVIGNDDIAIQNAINAAVSSGATKPIVHLGLKNYIVNNSIKVPAGSDLQLVGDEVKGTELIWNSSTNSGPVLSISSPSTTISNLTIAGGGAAEGLLLQLPDQPNTTVVGDQLLLQGGNAVSLMSDSMEHTIQDYSSLYTMGTIAGIAVSGGSIGKSGQATLGRVDDLSGSMQAQDQGVSLSITQHGRLLVQDDWHDGNATGPYNFQLTDSGTLTEQGGAVFAGATPFVMNNFSGDVTLLGLQFAGGFEVSATTNSANLLTIGMAAEGMPFSGPLNSGFVTVGNLADGAYQSGTGGYQQTASSPAPEVSWLRHMLGQVRAETAVPLSGSNATVTHLNRVQILNSPTALHVRPSGQMSGEYLTLEAQGGGFLSDAGPCVETESSTEESVTARWTLQSAGEGDFLLIPAGQNHNGGAASLIQDASGNWILSVQPLGTDYQEHWNMQLGSDGLYRLVNRGTGLALTHQSGCATGTSAGNALTEGWKIVSH